MKIGMLGNFQILNILKKKLLGRASYTHFKALTNYSTPLKLKNLLLCEYEKRKKVISPKSMPYTVTVDITNICNLKCPLCPTGRKFYGRKPSYNKIKDLETFLDEVGKYLIYANLYNWGEPLLHPKIDEIVKLFHSRKIHTSISSNLNIKDKDKIINVCDAGLDHIIISADGANEDIYQIYRKGGNFNLLLENIKLIVNYKKQKNKKTPSINWQFIPFRHNEHEINDARELALSLGVDKFVFNVPIGPDEWQPKDEKLKGDHLQSGDSFCTQLWQNITIHGDGGIVPCCHLFNEEDDFSKLGNDTIKNIRNNELFKDARKFFNPKWVDSLDPSYNHPCKLCPLLKRQDHLLDYLNASKKNNPLRKTMGVFSQAKQKK